MFARPHTGVTTILMAFALVAGVAACGGDDDDDSSAEVTQPTTAPSTGTTIPQEGAETTGAETATTQAGSSSVPGTTGGSTAPLTTDPCGEYGPLVTHDLNDRCEPAAGELGPTFAASTSVWNVGDSCVDMVAVPNEIVVAVDPSLTLATEVEDVVDQLSNLADPISAEAGEVFGTQAQILVLDADSAVQVQNLLPGLQRMGRSVDLNYLEPLQPNNAFRPADDPEPADGEQMDTFGGGENKIIAVIDSPDDSKLSYDVDGNHYIDEDNGHGVFVQSIVQRSGATVDLFGVYPSTVSPNPSVLGTGRWAPMMFSDGDIIRTLLEVSTETNFVNMSLGGVGCPSKGIGDRLALGRVMNNMRLQNDSLRFVAAAGNNGLDVVHFPAGWRHPDLANIFGDAIRAAEPPPESTTTTVQSPDDIAAELKEMHAELGNVIFAVGSVEQNDQRSDYSNCGGWVNAVAWGTDQLGVYPSAAQAGYPPATAPPTSPPPLPTLATWSGTSFATANFTASLASESINTDPNQYDPNEFDTHTGARITDPATGLPCTPASATTTSP